MVSARVCFDCPAMPRKAKRFPWARAPVARGRRDVRDVGQAPVLLPVWNKVNRKRVKGPRAICVAEKFDVGDRAAQRLNQLQLLFNPGSFKRLCGVGQCPARGVW